MKIYISGPITGVKDYEHNFSKAEDALKTAGFVVINPAKINACLPPSCTSWQQYLDVDLVILKQCDAIYMLNGWEDSAGANIEKHTAEKENKVILYENSNL